MQFSEKFQKFLGVVAIRRSFLQEIVERHISCSQSFPLYGNYTVGNRVIPLNCLTIDTVQLLDKATPFQTVFCLLLCDNATFY